MTSVMRRPQSTQPGDLGRGDMSHTPGRPLGAAEAPQHSGNAHTANGNGTTYSVPSPSALGMSGSDATRLPTFSSYGGMAMSGEAAAGSSSGGISGEPGRLAAVAAAESSGHGASGASQGLHLPESIHHTLGGHPALEAIGLDSRTIFDDPGILSLATQSHDPNSTRDLSLTLNDPDAPFAFPITRLAGSSGSLPNAFSDIDLASSGMLQFPELPASLLDQGPEYEYSVHTQSNVFDAVQDYNGAGEEEAARVFGLDRYDPTVNHDSSRQPGASDVSNDGWATASYGVKQEDASADQSVGESQQAGRVPALAHYTNASLGSGDGLASFQENASMVSSGEYPMASSTAPTSRASEWKFETSAASVGSDSNIHESSFPSQKYRRDSYEDSVREGSASATAMSSSPTTLFSYQQATPQHGREDDSQRSGGHRQLHQGPLVPSQGSGSGGMHGRSRIASWGGENVQYVDEWSSLPGHGSLGHLQGMPATSANMLRPGYAALQSGSGRQGHFGPDRTGHSRPDMMQALGSAMDATMETDGIAKCPYPNCTKTFAKNRSYNLKAHLRSHSQLKPYQCTHCPRAFSRKHDLERHSRVHSGDKPYLCEACGKGFPRSDALRRHWRVEKECGDKAVEIEAKQPLPSLPPGVNVPSAHAHGPMPGVLHVGPAVTTSMSSSGMPSSMSVGSGMHAYGQLQHSQVQLQHQYHPHHQPHYTQQPQHQPATSHMGQTYQQQQQGGMGLSGNGAVGSYPYSSQPHDARPDRSER